MSTLRDHKLPPQQQGVALIIVLLILSIATIAVVSMSSSRQLDIRRTENLLRSAQAF
ncbi:MAG: general secretion pathway protein GspK, partial [Methylovulum sp.]